MTEAEARELISSLTYEEKLALHAFLTDLARNRNKNK